MAQQVNWGVLGAASIAVQRVIPATHDAPSSCLPIRMSMPLGSYAINALNLICGRAPARVAAVAEHDPRFRIDRLTSALLDYGDAHASLTVASQAGPAAWATHQQLTVLGTRGWLRMNFPFAQARPVVCRIEIGDQQVSVPFLRPFATSLQPISTLCKSSVSRAACSARPFQRGRSKMRSRRCGRSRPFLPRLATVHGKHSFTDTVRMSHEDPHSPRHQSQHVWQA